MNAQGRIPLRRGAVCGLVLILLGLWAGLAPFVGPYFHFGYTPDKAWAFNSGRLYYSAIPGAAVLLGGVIAIATRNRGVGVCAGLLAALGGGWLALGHTFTTVVLKKSILVGSPILAAGAGSGSVRSYVETLALFTGLGLVAAFAGALTAGRFSLLAATDVAEEEDYYTDLPAAQPSDFRSAIGQLPDTTTTTALPPDTMS